MPLSTDIHLPRDHEAKWPKACVRCLRENPSESVSRVAHGIGWTSFAAPLLPVVKLIGLTGPSVDVPVCAECIDSVRRERWLRSLAMWAPIVTILALATQLGWFGQGRHFVLGVILLFSIPAFVFEIIRPPWIEVYRAKNKRLSYEFRRKDFAERFAELNVVDGEGTPT